MGVVNTTYTFGATDTITSSKMNNIIDDTTFTTDAIIGTTLEVASGKLKIRSQGITTNELGEGSVTSYAIVDGTIVNADINASADIAGSKLADNSTSGVKLTDTSVTPAKLAQPLTLATAQASTSGTSIDFTSIPSWVKRITVMFSAVSTNGASSLLIQIGDSGGIENTGYSSVAADFGAGTSEITTGFVLDRLHSSFATFKGSIVLNVINGNTFVCSGILANPDVTYGPLVSYSAGSKALSAQLDRVRITTVNGTDTFDAGSINIIYE